MDAISINLIAAQASAYARQDDKISYWCTRYVEQPHHEKSTITTTRWNMTSLCQVLISIGMLHNTESDWSFETLSHSMLKDISGLMYATTVSMRRGKGLY